MSVAFAADTVVGTITQTSPILEYIKEIAFTLIAIGGTALLVYLKKMLGLRTDDLMANRVRLGIMSGLRRAYDQYTAAAKKAGTPKIDDLTAASFDYAKDHYPEAMKYHGLLKAGDITEIVESLLPLVEKEREAPPPTTL